MKYTTKLQMSKYHLFSRLPGRFGARYKRKRNMILTIDEFHFAIRQSRNKTCIDLGANVGEYTRVMADSGCPVIAFEPDPWAFKQLEENLSSYSNVKLENVAAGTFNGTTALWRHSEFDACPERYSVSSSTIESKFPIEIRLGPISVRAVDFIEYLEHLDDHIGVIKMDIEGAEVDILERLLDCSSILSRIDHMFVETHEYEITTHRERVDILRQRTRELSRPRINLDWP